MYKIVDKEVKPKQLRFEKLHSLKSIVIFGFSSFPVIYLIRIDKITLLDESIFNAFLGIIILTLWNEIHFFVVHRTLHFKPLLKHVHWVHHKSRISTVYSVYSFHWFEALLLSTVPITIVPFIPFSPLGIFLYPLASILLNYSGHSNYWFVNGKGADWKLFGVFHNDHHYKFTDNYGFATHLLDKLNTKLTSRNKMK